MSELEKAVAYALRLNTLSASELIDEIKRCIDTARAELIRSGVSSDVVNADGDLVRQAIITYCLMTMGDEDSYERNFNAFQYQQDNLRKS